MPNDVVNAEALPSIEHVPDDAVSWTIRCEATGRPYRIQKGELDFYRSNKLSLPRLHPDERHRRRSALRNPRRLWERRCGKCNDELLSSYHPARPEVVLCDPCYLQDVA